MEVFCIYFSHKSPLAGHKIFQLNFEHSKKSKKKNKREMSPGKETPTAPPPNEVTSSSAVPELPVTLAPPVAGYPIQQIPLQEVPMVQHPPYPAAYPQNYQQQYHPTQPGQTLIYPTSQTTPLMGDANEVELQQVKHSLHHQQQQARQQQRRRVSSIETIDSDDCCDGFCCCLDICNDYCCCCCKSIFDLLCNLIGKIFGAFTSLMAFILIAWLIYHFFFES